MASSIILLLSFALNHGVDGARAKLVDGELLLCTDVKKYDRVIIDSKDRAFFDYAYEKGVYYTQARFPYYSPGELDSYKSKLECEPAPSDLNTSLHCDSCIQSHFDMTWLAECGKATDQVDFKRIQDSVVERGGNCLVGGDMTFSKPLSKCKTNHGYFAKCRMDSDSEFQKKKAELELEVQTAQQKLSAAVSHVEEVHKLFF